MPAYEKQLQDAHAAFETQKQRELIYKEAVRTNEIVRDKVLDQILEFEDQRDHVSASLADVKRKLASLYSTNVIYDSYRNMVAISWIIHYLQSGISTELTGPTGAYAQYQNDLRAKIITDKMDELTSIVKKGFSDVAYSQSLILQELMDIHSGVMSVERTIAYASDSINQTARRLGDLLMRETEYSQHFSNELAKIREASERTANNAMLICFNQYMDARNSNAAAYMPAFF